MLSKGRAVRVGARIGLSGLNKGRDVTVGQG